MKTTFVNRCRAFSLAMTVSLGLVHSTAMADVNPTSYDLNTDWSDTQNPDGVWSYNYNDSPIPVHQTFWWGQGGWGIYSFGEASIVKGSAPTGSDPFGGTAPPPHDWQPGDVMMHAVSIPYGGDTTFLNVRWTSPVNGMINVTGSAWDGMLSGYPGRDAGWALLVGGQTIAQRYSVLGLYRNDAGAQFAGNLLGNASLTAIPVTMGEVVEFRVMTDTYYGQFVGINENITLVPEVGSVPLLLTGIIGLGLSRRFWPRPASAS